MRLAAIFPRVHGNPSNFQLDISSYPGSGSSSSFAGTCQHHGGQCGGSSRDEYCKGRLLFPLTNHPPMSRGGARTRNVLFFFGRQGRHCQIQLGLCARKKPCPLRKDRFRPMARRIAAIMYRKSCLIEANSRCKGFPRIIVNVVVARNKINQLYVNFTKFLFSTQKIIKSTCMCYVSFNVFLYLICENKYKK